ncbi:MAG: hypothetical protein J5U17_01175 [Candidatus Methanoperedens sp.]|nr:hypothetical protein [Candidatus Methanoperedens sp.]MCE8427297.1 hypothetical protein [Candidatus Methanoperedens sp.]
MSPATWIVIILLIIIVMVLPVVPKENCVNFLGQNVVCVTEHVSIIQLIFGK